MARAVVTCMCEDNVSPLLRKVSRSLLTLPAGAELPPLPDAPVVVESAQRGSNLDLVIRPSPDLTAWIADVQQLAAR